VRHSYQSQARKSSKFKVVGGRELLLQLPMPLWEAWEELHACVEELAGEAGLKILHGILEEEVRQRVGPPHRPDPAAGAVRWGRQPGYVAFGGQKIGIHRPRVRTRDGEEVELESYGKLQQDDGMQRAVAERIVCGLSTRKYRRAVQSVLLRHSQEQREPTFRAGHGGAVARAVRKEASGAELGGVVDRWNRVQRSDTDRRAGRGRKRDSN